MITETPYTIAEEFVQDFAEWFRVRLWERSLLYSLDEIHALPTSSIIGLPMPLTGDGQPRFYPIVKDNDGQWYGPGFPEALNDGEIQAVLDEKGWVFVLWNQGAVL